MHSGSHYCPNGACISCTTLYYTVVQNDCLHPHKCNFRAVATSFVSVITLLHVSHESETAYTPVETPSRSRHIMTLRLCSEHFAL